MIFTCFFLLFPEIVLQTGRQVWQVSERTDKVKSVTWDKRYLPIPTSVDAVIHLFTQQILVCARYCIPKQDLTLHFGIQR